MAFVQDDVGTPADGGTLAFGSNVGSGVLLVACIAQPIGITTSGITDSLGNTWAVAKSQIGGTQGAELWYAHCPTGGACTLTFDWSGAASPQVCIAEFDGFTNGVALDQTAGNEITGTTVDYGTITTTQASSVIVAAGRDSSGYTVNTIGDGFSALTYGTRQCSHYKISSSTETVNCDLAMAASEAFIGAIASFYDTGGGGGSATLPGYIWSRGGWW